MPRDAEQRSEDARQRPAAQHDVEHDRERHGLHQLEADPERRSGDPAGEAGPVRPQVAEDPLEDGPCAGGRSSMAVASTLRA